MLNQAAIFLVETVVGLFVLALLLRFYLQLVRAPYGNPVSRFLNALTNFVVLPARRVVPGLWGMDLATLALAWLCEVLLLFALLGLRGMDAEAASASALVAVMFVAAVRILKMSIYILMVAVIVQAILSWVNPYSPIGPLLDSLTKPFLRPLQRRIPQVGGVDLSPLVLIIVLQLGVMLIGGLEIHVTRLL